MNRTARPRECPPPVDGAILQLFVQHMDGRQDVVTGQVRQARNAAGGGTWARAVACTCAVGLAVLFPQLAWADTGTDQLEVATDQVEAAAQGVSPGAVCEIGRAHV